MRIYEYGKENPECILLIHPSLVEAGIICESMSMAKRTLNASC